MRSNTAKHFKAGMFLLENLTSGMYNEPLVIFREYVQNAVDSIDISKNKGRNSLTKVSIELDPAERKIVIRDNGMGIPSRSAEQILSSIGSSDKTGQNLRGFRGIGRLGGIAFSDKAVFRTKADGESVESWQEWDCEKLRRVLTDPSSTNLSLEKLFASITTFYQDKSKHRGGFFEVALLGVNSFRNYLFDLERVRNYLSQVAPVPFDQDNFSFSCEINSFLQERIPNYGQYNIMLNGMPVYKPYRDDLKITKEGKDDRVKGIKTFQITLDGNEVAAFGWYGERENLIGSIRKGEVCSGIRVRVGNILLGDSHLLDKCFREERFNSYIIGEIHVVSPKLIPNSRRDDFVDNESKTYFYNAVEQEIGLPISKEIRLRSRLKSLQLPAETNSPLHTSQRDLFPKNSDNSEVADKSIILMMRKLCGRCPRFREISSSLSKT